MEFWGSFLGNMSIGYYISWYVWSLIGLMIVTFIAFTNKGNNSEFSFSYFFKDNKWDLLLWFIGTFIVARFIQDLKLTVVAVKISDMFVAFTWGFFHTSLIRIIRDTKFGKFLKLPYKANGELRNEENYKNE